jgi:hypothetical protein
MKLCVIHNYNGKGYINEILTLNKIINSLQILPEDIYEFNTPNIVYNLNKNYTHTLIFMDYRVSSIELYKNFFDELKIPKVFIIDTIPHHNKKINEEFINSNVNGVVNIFCGLPIEHQMLIYENYSDGFIFLNHNDVKLFQEYYPLKNEKPFSIIPPSLGKKEDLKINLNNIKPNNNIGFNGYPSSHSGIFDLLKISQFNPNYNFNLYGSHGRDEVLNEMIINHLTMSNPKIKFKGRMKNDEKFFNENFIYGNLSIYDTFDYYTFLSVLNGSIPIINEKSGTSEFFKDYPFIINNKIDVVTNKLNEINNLTISNIKDVLNNTLNHFKKFNDEDNYEKYINFFNSL